MKRGIIYEEEWVDDEDFEEDEDSMTEDQITTCRALEKDGVLEKYCTRKLINQWFAYKKSEEARIKEELALQLLKNDRRAVLNKLTPKEKKLIGLTPSVVSEIKDYQYKDIELMLEDSSNIF